MRIKYVDYCPVCDSPKTGYFIGGVPNYKNIIKKFQKGERIDYYSLTSNRNLNCFCKDCGHKWHSNLKKVDLTHEEFNEYLHERGFYEERDEAKKRAEEKKIKKPEIPKEEKARRFKTKTTILAYTTGIDLRRFNPYKDDKDEKQ